MFQYLLVYIHMYCVGIDKMLVLTCIACIGVFLYVLFVSHVLYVLHVLVSISM